VIRALFAGLLCAPMLALAGPPILVVDLSEAYSRSTALAGLLSAVDDELKAMNQRHRPELDSLQQELRALKSAEPDNREAHLRLIRRINEIETTVEREQERLSDANQAAIAQVDAAIARVKLALKKESGAATVLDIQETQYVRPDCPCLATERMYVLLNAELPRVDLALDAH
jgi:Skp family chaperone for outer membrane proteins